MRTELARMREKIRAALPEKAFLRRDRGDALFISNAPAFENCPEAIPGFLLEKQKGMLCILPDDCWIFRTEAYDAPVPDHFAASLLRFRGKAPDRENRILFARGIKLLDAASSAAEREILSYDRALRQRSALALRGGCGGGLYACARILAKIHTLYKGETRP